MKGTVVSTWIKSCRKMYGDDVVNEAMGNAGLKSDRTFSPIEDIEDSVPKTITKFIAQKENIKEEQLWRKIGFENISTFANDYPAFFKYENLYSFLKAMYDIHTVVVKRIKGAKPPILNLKPVSNHEAIFTYTSQREMYDYFMGLLSGAAEHFGEKIETEEISKKEGHLELKLKFEKEIYTKKNFAVNKILSFGFIKNLSVKSAVLSTIIFSAIYFALYAILKKVPVYAAPVLAFASCLISEIALSRPVKYIIDEIQRINSHEYVEKGTIVTGDDYERIFEAINSYKESVRKDFVGFKGLTDEMNTFTETLRDISKKMNDTSEGISGVVEQVASAATSQAEETQNSAGLLSDNVEEIKNAVSSENENKAEIEKAVGSIENSFKNVNATVQKLNDIFGSFEKVKDKGNEIQNKVASITDIVSMVSGISSQTNLLALNASIEAARAGEAGKGFAVVADEVRKLAEQTQQAVDSINSSLTQFTADVENLISSVTQQFNALNDEKNRLNSAVVGSSTSNEKLRSVAKLMITTSEKLKAGVESISGVFEKIESLASIAEENSASSEEVSADVNTYINEIKRLTGSIDEFKNLTEQFKDDLDIYRI